MEEKEEEARKAGIRKLQIHRGGSGRKKDKELGGVKVKCHRGWRKGMHMSIAIQAQEGTYVKHSTGSDVEAIVDFVKNHEGLSDKTNEHFKEKARKDYIWETFDNSSKLSVSVQGLVQIPKDLLQKLTKSTCDQAPKEMTEMQNWI